MGDPHEEYFTIGDTFKVLANSHWKIKGANIEKRVKTIISLDVTKTHVISRMLRLVQTVQCQYFDMLLLRSAFTSKCFYFEVLLLRSAFTSTISEMRHYFNWKMTHI